MSDPRRSIPRTDAVLADPRVRRCVGDFGRERVKAEVLAAQARARSGELEPGAVVEAVLAALEPLRAAASTLTPVINATGVIVHTNLGRAPLSAAARQAVVDAAGYVDVELDLETGVRSRRGAGVLAALRAAVPDAGGALVVNNGAAALLLAATALAAGREVVVSRGELVEIGDGFRLPALIESAGARLREVGTTNRTNLADYAEAVGPQTGAILKVHPSNFRVEGFTSAVDIAELAPLAREHGLPLVADLGSGLLRADPVLPDEPDATSALQAGASLVTASGDKLLGGPQTGLVLGDGDLVERLRRHPMQRALRVDKLTLAALEATLRGPVPPVAAALRRCDLRERTTALAARLSAALGRGGPGDGPDGGPEPTPGTRTGAGERRTVEVGAVEVGAVAAGAVEVVASEGRVGGGGAPGVPLSSWALALPEHCAATLRRGRPAVLARVERGRCLVDLRCVPAEQEEALLARLVDAVRG